jgi:hypothetical protein
VAALAVLTLVFRPGAAGARPSVAEELERFEDGGSLSRKARTLLARLVTAGDFERCHEVIAYIRGQVDQDEYPLLEPMEAAALAILTGDAGLLDGVLAGHRAAEPWSEYRCVPDPLLRALQARVPEARRAVAGWAGSGEDRRFSDLLLLALERAEDPRCVSLGRSSDVDREAGAFLDDFPNTGRRQYLLAVMVKRYGPISWSWGGRISLLSRLGNDQLGAAFGGGLGLQVGHGAFQLHAGLDGSFGDGRPALRRSLVHDGRSWPSGATTGWGGGSVALGYRVLTGRHAALLALGYARETFSEPGPEMDAPGKISFGSYLGALEYQFTLTGAPSEPLTGLAFLRFSARRPVSSGPLASAAFIVELGLAAELRHRERLRR